MDILHFVYPFTSWWIFGLLPVLDLLWIIMQWTFAYKSLCLQNGFDNYQSAIWFINNEQAKKKNKKKKQT